MRRIEQTNKRMIRFSICRNRLIRWEFKLRLRLTVISQTAKIISRLDSQAFDDRSAPKRSQDAAHGENFSRVDGLIDQSRDRLLEELAPTDPPRHQVIQPGL